MCCNIHGLILYLAKVALVAVELCEFALVWDFSFSFLVFPFSSLFLHLCRLASMLFTLMPRWIKDNNSLKLNEPADLEKKTIQTNNKKQQLQENSLNIFTEQIFKGQLFSLTVTSQCIFFSFLFIMFLLSFKRKNETCHMESGSISLVIIKLPYCLCRELVVSVEPCDCL